MLFRLKVGGEGENTLIYYVGHPFALAILPETLSSKMVGQVSCHFQACQAVGTCFLLRNAFTLDPDMSAQVYVCTYTIQYLRILLRRGIDRPAFYLSN